MPLVERIIDEENESTTFQKANAKHVLYVPPNRVLRTDKIVPPESKAQLAELAMMYPDEYAELAKKEKVTPGDMTQADDRRVAELMAMPMKDIVKTIDGLDEDEDLPFLCQILEAETGDAGQKRKPVLLALEKKGVKDEDAK